MNAILVILIIFVLCIAVRFGKFERRLDLIEEKIKKDFSNMEKENSN